MLEFVRRTIALRKRRPCLMRRHFLVGEKGGNREMPDVWWHGVRIDDPLWNDFEAQILAFTLAAVADEDQDLHVMMNMSTARADIELPALNNRYWCVAIDTARSFPHDAILPEDQTPFKNRNYPVEGRSIVVMESSIRKRWLL
jgi:isoamylase